MTVVASNVLTIYNCMHGFALVTELQPLEIETELVTIEAALRRAKVGGEPLSAVLEMKGETHG
ncbi:MAG TPA: hypothetical protein P5121_05180 [Caldilineaceae bacterium]|nr:hypothetical protein [Caldilineaceae bacterium]